MSREKVTKYFEIRFFSLSIVAIMVLILFAILFIIFVWRGQYFYALAIAVAAVIIALAAAKVLEYARTLRRSTQRHESGSICFLLTG